MRCLNLGTYMALKWRWHLLEPLGLSRNGAHTALAYYTRFSNLLILPPISIALVFVLQDNSDMNNATMISNDG